MCTVLFISRSVRKVECRKATVLAAVDTVDKAYLYSTYMFNITATNNFGTFNTSFTHKIANGKFLHTWRYYIIVYVHIGVIIVLYVIIFNLMQR